MKKTLLILAEGFETMEFSVFVDVLGWARNDFDYQLPLETCGFTKTVNATFNVPVIVDKTIDEINVDDYEALAFPGGFANYNFYESCSDERLLNLIRAFDEKGKIIASICVASIILGQAGILKGRKATTYHLKNGRRQKQLAQYDVDVVNERIVVDKNVISSYCPETAPDVAFKLLEMLTSLEEALKVKTLMGY